MTATIGAVVPPVLPRQQRAIDGQPAPVGHRLPLPTLPKRRTASVVYGLVALDCHGRIAERTITRTLGWTAGLRLRINENGGVLTATPDARGCVHVIGPGHFRVPAPLRHRCGLAAGDRVLLVADPDRSRLAIYPPAVLDSLLPGGETA